MEGPNLHRYYVDDEGQPMGLPLSFLLVTFVIALAGGLLFVVAALVTLILWMFGIL